MKNTINDFITAAEDFSQVWQVERWQIRVSEYLGEAINLETAQNFNDLTKTEDDTIFDNFTINNNVFDNLSRQLGFLQALIGKIDSHNIAEDTNSIITTKGNNSSSKKIFVVHGHDEQIKESVARFVERLGLEAIILHEKPNGGKTIIEKFEKYSDVSFTIVLLTPDDFGGSKLKPKIVNDRARQNVIFELGFFIGKYSRNRVCALLKDKIEYPSDYSGVIYINIDSSGAWKFKLAKEMKQAGLDIDLNKVI